MIDHLIAAICGGVFSSTLFIAGHAYAIARAGRTDRAQQARKLEELSARTDRLEAARTEADRDIEMLCQNTGNRRQAK
jgi:hypothetical protein